MTLIASFSAHNSLIILGDLLITQNTSSNDNNFPVPSVIDENALTDKYSNLKIVGLNQKVNLISGRICVAWAGSYLQAKTLITELYQNCRSRKLSFADYEKILHQYPKNDLTNLEVISHFIDGPNYKTVCFNVPEMELNGLSNVRVSGSGTEFFIQGIENAFKNDQFYTSEYVPPYIAASSAALGFNTALFGTQLLTGSGISEGWGGGFELAFIKAGKFAKITDVLYLFFEAQEHNDGSVEITNIPIFIKSNYQGSRFKILVYKGGEKYAEQRLYVADPLFPIETTEPIKVPHLDYTWLVNYFYFISKTGKQASFQRVERFVSKTRPVKIDVTNDKFSVNLDNAYYEDLVKFIYESKPKF